VIRLTCAHCQATLEVDDAFAGGVCRCQHCGTIQTVPRPGEKAVTAEASRALYQVQSRSGQSSAPSGLEELAEVIHSSGLAGSGLRNRSQIELPADHPHAHPHPKSRVPLIAAIAGAVVVLLIATIAVILLRSPSGAATLPDGSTAPGPAVTSTPNFAGIGLAGKRVIFVIDRGDATSDYFPSLKELTTRAATSLGSDRKFQVVLWDNGSVDSYPALGPSFATDEEVKKLAAWFDEVPTGRPTDVMPALKAAVAQSPDTIVLVTGKSMQLTDSDPEFATNVLNQLAGKKIIVHTVTLGESTPADPLRKIALETGGKFLDLSRSDIERLAGQ